jgi:hypothetical protein
MNDEPPTFISMVIERELTELDERFPGLLDSVLPPAVPA